MNQKKTKIIIAINDFAIGGAQMQLIKQLPYFNYHKFDFYLITLFRFYNKKDIYHKIPSNIKIIKLNFKSFWDFIEWVKLIKIIKKINPDIVMSSLFYSNTIFRILSLIFKYKIITREHNTYLFKPKWQIMIDYILSRFSYKIVGVSKKVSEFTSKQEKINITKFYTINNGIDVSHQPPLISTLEKNNLRLKMNLPTNKQIFINVSRLNKQKNLNLLIDSFFEYYKINKNFILLIVGDGTLRSILQEKINKLNLQENIKLVAARDNIDNYYKASDILISTSLMEGFANVFLEALFYGLPIISTKTGGTEETVISGFNGVIINEYKIEDVVDAIVKIQQYDVEMLRKNSWDLCNKFDIKITVAEYEFLFNKIVKN